MNRDRLLRIEALLYEARSLLAQEVVESADSTGVDAWYAWSKVHYALTAIDKACSAMDLIEVAIDDALPEGEVDVVE